MLPRNFPGRKDAKRRSALERLKAIKNPSEGVLATIENTEAKLKENARNIRTKIDRSHRGKIK